MTVRVKYNKETTRVEGFYPSFVKYNNIVIDEDAKTIDGSPYIEVTEEEHQAALELNIPAVKDGALVEYTKTNQELVEELKNSKLAACNSYLLTTDWQAIRKAESDVDFKEGVAENRALARSLQDDITNASTVEELELINTEFDDS
jgi:hypothetical protein